jgi:aryl-alcohol dehydrogenase-like predicted oxidoreductase
LGKFTRTRRGSVTIATKVGIRALPALEAFQPLLYVARGVALLARPLYRGDPFACRIDISAASSVKQAQRSVAASLRALGTEYLDLLLLHDPDPNLELADSWTEWLVGLKRKGIVRAIGLAGEAASCVRIAARSPETGQVLQVGDSLERREADLVLAKGRPLQITYGYLRAARLAHQGDTRAVEMRAITRQIMERNATGVVLFSSTSPTHIRQFALSNSA